MDLEDAAEEREALRVRLYQPGASEDDRRRFAELDGDSTSEPVDSGVVPARARRRWAPRVAVTVALLVAVGVGLLAVQHLASSASSTARNAPTPPPTVGRQISAGLVALEPGTERSSLVPSTVGGVPVALQRVRGSGTTVVPIRARPAQHTNGTMLVMLTGPGNASPGWFSTRPVPGSGPERTVEIMAEREPTPADPRATPSYNMIWYDGAPPTRLVVQDPEGAGWALTVGFLPRGTLPY